MDSPLQQPSPTRIAGGTAIIAALAVLKLTLKIGRAHV